MKFSFWILLVLYGCSVGHLDLDGKEKEQTTSQWSQAYLDSTSMMTTYPYAEDGYSLFWSLDRSVNSIGKVSLTYADQFDQLLIPTDFSRPLLREAVRTVDFNRPRRNGPSSYVCLVDSRGVLDQRPDCPDGVICGSVAGELMSQRGPTPCNKETLNFELSLDLVADTLSLGFPDTERSARLERKTFGYLGKWQDLASDDAPPALVDPAAEVVGPKIMVFGKTIAGGLDGGLYDPGLNTWVAMAKDGRPDLTGAFRALWTGSQILVVFSGGGAIFDPATNAWREISKENAPNFGGSDFVAAFDEAGKQAYVWGESSGQSGTRFSLGAIYDVKNNVWTAISTTDAPAGAPYSGAAWTGTEFLVWSKTAEGRALYFPQTGEWLPFDEASGMKVAIDDEDTVTHIVSGGNRVLIEPQDLLFEDGKWARAYLGEADETSTVRLSKDETLVVGGKDDGTLSRTLAIGAVLHKGVAPILLPTSASTPEWRTGAAVVRTNDYLFIYGGCKRVVSDRCQSFSNAGSIIRLAKFQRN